MATKGAALDGCSPPKFSWLHGLCRLRTSLKIDVCLEEYLNLIFREKSFNMRQKFLWRIMGRRTGQNSQLHLYVLNFIYASSTSFMRPQLHLCVLNFIYACSTSFMRPQLHLCLLNFIYASSTSFMPAQLHLCVLNFIYACSTSFMLAQLHLCLLNFIYASSTFFTMLNFFHHAQLFSPCSTFFTMLNFFTPFTHVVTISIALCVTA